MSARQPRRPEEEGRERTTEPEESREYTAEPQEVVQISTEADMPVTGGGHVVREQEPRQRIPRRWLLLAVLVLALLLLLAPLVMSTVWLGQALALVGGLGWYWVPVVIVILLLGAMTAYYVVLRNV